MPLERSLTTNSTGGGGAVSSVNGQTGAVVLTTTNVNEGTNQYYTAERTQDMIATFLTAGANISLTYDDTNNTLTPAVTGIGSTIQAWDADLDGLAAMTSGAGVVCKVGAGAFSQRTLMTASTNRINISNGSGGGGNPTFDVGADIVQLTATQTLTNKTLQRPNRVVTAAGAITVVTTDYYIGVNKTVGAATTVNLPAGVVGMEYIIKDEKCDAATNNITITPAAGNIISTSSASTYVMNQNGQSATVIYNGTAWVVV